MQLQERELQKKMPQFVTGSQRKKKREGERLLFKKGRDTEEKEKEIQ